MKRKVAFFSETGTNQKYPRNFPNARTEVGWCLALDAPMCSLTQMPNDHFDLGIVIIPKKNPLVDLNLIRTVCDTVAVMQEGPSWYFHDYSVENQFHFYNTLMQADRVYCHNSRIDKRFYKGMGIEDVRVMRSLMIPEGLESKPGRGTKVMIGGNFVSWYGGFSSYILAREYEMPIVAPSMGRKQAQEDLIDDIEYLPYLSWRQWIEYIPTIDIGIHMMPTYAAGTFSMNLAWHGKPCVGYYGTDTQEILHPLTTVEEGDLEGAKTIVHRLRDNSGFYERCSNKALTQFKKHYTEKAWKRNWNQLNGWNKKDGKIYNA